MSRFGNGCDAWWKHFFQEVVATRETRIWLQLYFIYHIMNELVNDLHILILGTFSFLIKPKFVLTTHNNNKKVLLMFFLIGEFLSIST